MYKQHLLSSIEKEIKICRRLSTKIPPDKMDFRPKEGVRSILELLQYLGIAGSMMLSYWLQKDDTDFNTFFSTKVATSATMQPEQFLAVMDQEMAAIQDLFNQITEEDLLNREIAYPWGGREPLGQAIIATSIKWLSAYKLQLFLFINLCDGPKLATADAWALTEITS